MDFLLPRPFVPGSESSRRETFAPWKFRTLELSFPPTDTARSESSDKCVDLHVQKISNNHGFFNL